MLAIVSEDQNEAKSAKKQINHPALLLITDAFVFYVNCNHIH